MRKLHLIIALDTETLAPSIIGWRVGRCACAKRDAEFARGLQLVAAGVLRLLQLFGEGLQSLVTPQHAVQVATAFEVEFLPECLDDVGIGHLRTCGSLRTFTRPARSYLVVNWRTESISETFDIRPRLRSS